MVKANKNDMTASTLVSSIIIVIKITNWKRKYTLPNHHHRNHCNHHLLVQVFVSPCVLLLYPVWILPVTLGLGFYGGLRQVNLLLALLFFAFVLFLCLASKWGSDR